MFYRSVFLVLILVLIAVSFSPFFTKTAAFIDSCSGSISPSVLNKNSSTTLTVTVNNDSSEAAHFVNITSANTDIAITGVSADGWTLDYIDSAEAYFSGGTIGAGENASFTVSVTTADVVRGSESWEVKLDSDPAGSDTNICSGSFSTSITEVESTPPVISGITVSNISNSGATVTWTTDKAATSTLEYGVNTSYGTTASDSTLKTSHSLTISGLTSGTTYNFRVTSADEDGNSVQSGNNTLTTSSASTSSSSSVVSSSPQPTPTPTVVPDTVSPSVSISTNLSDPVAEVPIIRGIIKDNKSVSKVEYSLDGGRNWFFVPIAKYSDEKAGNFSFTPRIKEDGNHLILVRGIDSSGNTSNSGRYTLIIDRIPPKIGGAILTSGSQISRPDENGRIKLPSSVPYKLQFSSIGGAVDITIIATPGAEIDEQSLTFKAKRSQTSSIWSSDVEFKNPGDYEMSAVAIDGANNRTVTSLPTVHVPAVGIVRWEKDVLSDAKVEIYYFDKNEHIFTSWDGGAYSQKNPAYTDQRGQYSFILPKGKYYINITKEGYEDLVSEIFSLEENTVINSDFILKKKKLLSVGPLAFLIPSISLDPVPVVLKVDGRGMSSIIENPVVGGKIPAFALKSEDGDVTEAFFAGKKSIIGITNSWLPQTSIMIEQLGKMQGVNTLLLLPHESNSSVATYKKRGGYSTQLIADPDGILFDFFSGRIFPSFVAVDANGVVIGVSRGVFLDESIMK